MKIIFIILLSLFLGNYLDCKTERYPRIDLLKEKEEKKLIIGEWRMCNKIVDDTEISYNICPEFYFLENVVQSFLLSTFDILLFVFATNEFLLTVLTSLALSSCQTITIKTLFS